LVNKRRAVIVSVLDHDEDNAREGMFWILDGTGSKSGRLAPALNGAVGDTSGIENHRHLGLPDLGSQIFSTPFFGVIYYRGL